VSEPTERVVPVVILGQRYPIKSALDPTYVIELAAYVDEKMRTAAETGTSHDSLRLAVLAALNIADEYHQLRARHEAVGKEMGKKLGVCSQVVDQILKQAI
jgi:cell division protein ZapA